MDGLKKRKALRGFGIAALALAFVLEFPMAFPRMFGLTPYTVVSGSMEPAIHVGSLIYGKKMDISEIREGDVVVFEDPAEQFPAVVHRVVSLDWDAGEFRTKGDANDQMDPVPVPFSNYMGHVKSVIPRWGTVFEGLSKAYGRMFLCGLLVFGFFAVEYGSDSKEKNERRERHAYP